MKLVLMDFVPAYMRFRSGKELVQCGYFIGEDLRGEVVVVPFCLEEPERDNLLPYWEAAYRLIEESRIGGTSEPETTNGVSESGHPR